jgi:3'(2'), 5'-bisphosphate nucleotidase
LDVESTRHELLLFIGCTDKRNSEMKSMESRGKPNPLQLPLNGIQHESLPSRGSKVSPGVSIHRQVIVEPLIEIARMAAFGVLKYYQPQQDGSLDTTGSDTIEERVRLAKTTTMNIIIKGIRAFYPDIPIICERSFADPELLVTSSITSHVQCFLVNPLDGEMDFIRGHSSGFALSIGYCIGGDPVLGVICCPAASSPPPVFYSVYGIGAFAELQPQVQTSLHVSPVPPSSPRILSSQYARNIEKESKLSADKSLIRLRPPAAICLRFLTIADGSIHIFPHFSPTSEWETCAGHAIVMAAGGSMEIVNEDGTASTTPRKLEYGKSPPLNPPFIVYGKRLDPNQKADGEHREGNEGDEAVDEVEQSDTDSTDAIKDPEPSSENLSFFRIVTIASVVILPVVASIGYAYYFM